MATGAGCPPAALTQAVVELRLLMELTALRKLADRGLDDEELVVMRQLADATARSARRCDVSGYLCADLAFHHYLLGLTGDPDLPRVARPLLSRSFGHELRGEQAARVMATGASEHAALIGLLADEKASAADDLLRRHICRPLRAPARLGPGQPADTRI
jgi:DNA-binding GntR family transcriptional regulator